MENLTAMREDTRHARTPAASPVHSVEVGTPRTIVQVDEAGEEYFVEEADRLLNFIDELMQTSKSVVSSQ